jgi:hypothetical protein
VNYLPHLVEAFIKLRFGSVEALLAEVDGVSQQ